MVGAASTAIATSSRFLWQDWIATGLIAGVVVVYAAYLWPVPCGSSTRCVRWRSSGWPARVRRPVDRRGRAAFSRAGRRGARGVRHAGPGHRGDGHRQRRNPRGVHGRQRGPVRRRAGRPAALRCGCGWAPRVGGSAAMSGPGASNPCRGGTEPGPFSLRSTRGSTRPRRWRARCGSSARPRPAGPGRSVVHRQADPSTLAWPSRAPRTSTASPPPPSTACCSWRTRPPREVTGMIGELRGRRRVLRPPGKWLAAAMEASWKIARTLVDTCWPT